MSKKNTNIKKFTVLLLLGVLCSGLVSLVIYFVWWQVSLNLKVNSLEKNLILPSRPTKLKHEDFTDYLAFVTLQKEVIGVENTIRTTLFSTLGSLFFVLTAYFSWENLKVAKKTLGAAEAKEVAERFNKAVELLAHTQPHIHLGGIYILGEIATTEDNYYNPVMEMLTAYVRVNAPYADRDTACLADAQQTKDSNSASGNSNLEKINLIPRANIQVILLILSKGQKKRSDETEEKYEKFFPDLKGTDLQGFAVGANDDLKFTNFSKTNLKAAQLRGVNLSGATFQDANLQGAKLQGANLQGANLQGANLQGANLQGAKLQGAKLQGAKLHGVEINNKTHFDEKWHLVWQIINNKTEQKDFEGKDLSQANLSNAGLEGANLKGANLEGANLEGANLKGANLKGANLKGANLKGSSGLVPEQFLEAYCDKETQLP